MISPIPGAKEADLNKSIVNVIQKVHKDTKQNSRVLSSVLSLCVCVMLLSIIPELLSQRRRNIVVEKAYIKIEGSVHGKVTATVVQVSQ